jgi:hypothetical protein
MPANTPIYGFPYPLSTDLVANYPALGQELAEDIEAVLPGLGGLAPVAPTSIANSGGSASRTGNTTTFTGVSSLSLNGVFSATYENYLLILSGVVSSAGNQIYMRMRVAGTDNSANSYSNQSADFDSASVSAGKTTLTYAQVADWGTASQQNSVQIFRPALADNTGFQSFGTRSQNNPIIQLRSIAHTVATAYDGITIYPQAGTMTGKVSVYGYRK